MKFDAIFRTMKFDVVIIETTVYVAIFRTMKFDVVIQKRPYMSLL